MLYKVIKKNICLAISFLIFCLLFPMSVYSYWKINNVDAKTNTSIILIGEWGNGTDNPNINDFNEIIALITKADGLIMAGINNIHILGVQTSSNAPLKPEGIKAYDIIIWETITGKIISAQLAGNLTSSQADVMFNSWTNIENALVAGSDYPIAGTESRYIAGYVYTRADAPVSYKGADGNTNYWLARHDNVVSTPSIGSDWFMVSDTWVEQSYPVGSFIEHNNAYYHKVLATDCEPGVNDTIWEKLNTVDITGRNVPLWNSKTSWGNGFIVMHNDNYYYSTKDSNTTEPGLDDSWKIFVSYDSSRTVQIWNSNMTYDIGDVIKMEEDSVLIYMKTGYGSNNPQDNNWKAIRNYNRHLGVEAWNPDLDYGNGYNGTIVQYEGLIYEKFSWVGKGVPPPEWTSGWRRILRWSATQAPTPFSPGVYAPNTILSYENNYYLTTWTTWAGQTISSQHAFYFRKIELWNETRVYNKLGNPWNDPFNDNSTDVQYIAYTVDESNNKTFWTVKNRTTSAQSGSIIGPPGADNQNWEEYVFECTETTICTEVDGKYIVWDLNQNRTSIEITAPSSGTDTWIRREINCTEQYIFTVVNGYTMIWRNSEWRANNYPGTSDTPGGVDAVWQRYNYTTGRKYVYTVNAAGFISFFYSENESTTYPSISSEWTPLKINPENPYQYEGPEYVYLILDDKVQYYYVNQFVIDGIVYIDWFLISDAWVGNTDYMIYHWDEDNVYKSGDIVVYGISYTNTYRYFRLRDGLNSYDVVGHFPMSEDYVCPYWEPINVFFP